MEEQSKNSKNLTTEQIYCQYCKGKLLSKKEQIDHYYISCYSEISNFKDNTYDNLINFIHSLNERYEYIQTIGEALNRNELIIKKKTNFSLEHLAYFLI